MPKVIVSAISQQLMPTFLLIKKLGGIKDTLYFITTEKYKNISPLQYALADDISKFKYKIKTLALNSGEENDWNALREKMKNTFDSRPETEYIVNLTGGTKLESLALYLYFKDKPNAKILYMPFPKPHYINLDTNETIDVEYNTGSKEYFLLCDLEFNLSDNITCDKTYTSKFLDKWLNFSAEDLEALSLLKDYKDGKIEWKAISDDSKLKTFIKKIDAPSNWDSSNSSKMNLIKYWTGIWFEEYIRNTISETFNIDVQSAKIKLSNAPKDNEIDAVFIYNNNCFIFECKTMVESEWIQGAIDKLGNLANTTIPALSKYQYFVYLKKFNQNKNIENSLDKAKQQGIRVFGLENYPDEASFVSALAAQIKEDAGVKE